jgi:hypothetical protein
MLRFAPPAVPRLRLPLGRTVKRIDVISIMLPESEHEMHVPLGDDVPGVCRRSRIPAREETAKDEEYYPAH